MKKIITLLSLVLFCKVSLAQAPSYTVTSSQNFLITCGNPTVTVFVTSSAAPGYTFTFVTPGNYTLTAVSGTVTTYIPLTILSSTQAPGLNISSTGTVLSCATSSIQLQSSSNTASVSYLWASNQGTIATTASLNVNANYSIAPATAPFATYTLTVTDPLNQCSSDSVITIYQNIYPPNAMITSTVSALTCNTYSIQLNNNSTTGIPSNPIFQNNQPVIASSWIGPFIGLPPSNPNIYFAYTPGTYTLIAKDPNNGCTASTTKIIDDNRIYPILSQPGPFSVSCPNGTVVIGTTIQGNIADFSFAWRAGTTGIYIPTATSSTLMVNSPGYFQIVVTNQLNGCASQMEITVYACVGLNENPQPLGALEVFPNPSAGKIYFKSAANLPADIQLTICSYLGQIVFSQDNLIPEDGLDLDFLEAGIYYVKIESGKYSKAFKIVKE